MAQPLAGEQITGTPPPRSFILDASVMDFQEERKIIREDVKLNKIKFKFPAGVNKLDLLEECRALNAIDDFDMMYDITMQMLDNKDLEILFKEEDGREYQAALFHITDRFMNLRGIEFIDKYPVVVTWLTEFIGASLLKKFPEPGIDHSAQPKAPVDKKSAKKMRAVYQQTSL